MARVVLFWAAMHAPRMLLVSIVALSLFISERAIAESSGMDAYVAQVLERSPRLRARILRRDAYQRDSKAAGLYPDPEAALMLDRVPERPEGEMPMLRYQLSQMIMWPGKLRLMETAAVRRTEAAAALSKLEHLEVTRQAKLAYLMLMLNAGMRDINAASRELLTDVARAALARYSAGVGGHHEVTRAEVERNALDVEAVDLEGERVSTVAMMNALRDYPASSPIADSAPSEQSTASQLPPPTRLLELAIARRPELEQMRSMQREEQTMAELARKERYPDFMTSVWYNQMLGAPDTLGAMVAVKIPIFNVRRQTRISEASALRAASVGQDVQAMRAMIRFELADALRKVETARRSLDLIRTVALPRATESFAASLAGYSTGGVDIVGVLEAWRALQNMERARLEASVSYEMALVQLERTVGGPVRSVR